MSDVEIRRSVRRKRSVRAFRENGKTVFLMPAHLTEEEEQEHVRVLMARLDQREQRTRPSDDELLERARELSERWLDGRAAPNSIRWVSNQRQRWGSCSTREKTIRISDRLQGVPEWVLDYVILHELAHLIEANHSKRFYALVEPYPHHARAKGFLEGLNWRP